MKRSGLNEHCANQKPIRLIQSVLGFDLVSLISWLYINQVHFVCVVVDIAIGIFYFYFFCRPIVFSFLLFFNLDFALLCFCFLPHGLFRRIFASEVTKVTEIESEAGLCVKHWVILIELGYNETRDGKRGWILPKKN